MLFVRGIAGWRQGCREHSAERFAWIILAVVNKCGDFPDVADVAKGIGLEENQIG